MNWIALSYFGLASWLLYRRINARVSWATKEYWAILARDAEKEEAELIIQENPCLYMLVHIHKRLRDYSTPSKGTAS